VTLAPVDEARHQPGSEPQWNEWWSLDFSRDDGFGGCVRLALLPNVKVAWYWAYVVTPDHAGPVVVRDNDVALPRNTPLEVRADGLWGECTCEVPFEHWTYGLEAFGVRLDEPADAFRGEIGERLAVGFDLEWEVAGPPGETEPQRYEQPGTVHGEVLLARDRIQFEGHGVRAHGWGPTTPWSADHKRAPFDWRESFEVLRFAPVPLGGDAGEPLALVRALCRYASDDGSPTTGWAEWAATDLSTAFESP
jgi:hypothetical protein